jgi:hypothetical protein
MAAPGQSSPRLGLEYLWYGLVSVVCVLVILAAAVATAATRPSFCLTCHQQQAKTLAAGGHAGIQCDACHARSGGSGVADDRLTVVAMLPAKLIGAPVGGDPTVEDKRCLACHQAVLTGVRQTRGVRMSHVGVVGAKWPCSKCHPDSGHAAPSATNTGYTMEMCLPCHFTSTGNPASCRTCHSSGNGSSARPTWPTPWQTVHGKNWKITHGMGDLATCKA